MAIFGMGVVELPLLEIQKKQLATHERLCQKTLLSGDYGVLMVVSITAAQYALADMTDDDKKTLAHMSQDTLKVVCVGQATAQVLQKAGFLVAIPSDFGYDETNEGMLKMAMIDTLSTEQVLIWKGVGGRTLLSDTLKKRGVQVDFVDWYERIAPHSLIDRIGRLRSVFCSNTVMLITSQAAFMNWKKAAMQVGVSLQSICYLALGDRLTQLVKAHVSSVWVGTVYDLKNETLRHALASFSFNPTAAIL